MVQLHRVFKHRTNQRSLRRLEVEPLEQRRLLSATPQLLKDIVLPPSAGSGPADFTDVGGIAFFRANDGTNGYELWKSDGTTTGTVPVKDVNPGAYSSLDGFSYLTNVNGTLFFNAFAG